MKLAIMGYNNTPHSNTKHTPFEILFGHLNQKLPFDINEENILTDYVDNHAKNSQQIYERIRTRLFTEKEKRTQNANEKRSDPETLKPDETIFIKNDQLRNKTNPRFIKTTVDTDLDKKIPYHNLTIIPSVPYLGMSTETYIATSESCPKIEDTYICDATSQPKDDSCLVQLLSSANHKNCPVHQVMVQKPILSMIEENHILVIPVTNLQVPDCQNGIHSIDRPVILNLPEGSEKVKLSQFTPEPVDLLKSTNIWFIVLIIIMILIIGIILYWKCQHRCRNKPTWRSIRFPSRKNIPKSKEEPSSPGDDAPTSAGGVILVSR
ncbi:hypothetical protein NQ317_019016 [Molorchus minor]|uniref:Envelope protein n=1 Tax=Molorchus minor TaxID=1323400 RepID=A0ABQ9J4I4_9CUCU|nr:hypothetical protein NQ317_019016 [Molorchus minor]